MGARAATVDVIEHRHHVEQKWVRKRTWVADDRVPVTRYVCSCGVATKWYSDPNTARKESKKHALDGQLAHQ